jgi:hypothetical protein
LDGTPIERRIHLDRSLLFYDYLRVEGWLFPEPEALESIDVFVDGRLVHTEKERFMEPSPDIDLHPNCRFSISTLVTRAQDGLTGSLTFNFAQGEPVTLDLAYNAAAHHLEASSEFYAFLDQVRATPGASLLEVGSRARSGTSFRHLLEGVDYVGVDVMDGENVDIVGDAHELSHALSGKLFDFVFSWDVFEHLAMPWKVVLELNKVMKIGALVYVGTPQACGLHDFPWDFWRFSDMAFRALFNERTGFELVECRMAVPMHLVPFHTFAPKWKSNENSAGYYHTAAIARKIAETDLEWDVPLSEVVTEPYPG